MTSEAECKATRGEVAGRWESGLARAARLGIAVAAVLMFAVLPLQAQTKSLLYTFAGPPTDGATPLAGLIMDGSGNLYGTTAYGGTSTACPGGCGTVFELAYSSTSKSYTEKVLYNFTGLPGHDGEAPLAGLIMDSSGDLYGTTEYGGTSTACLGGCGTVFELVGSSGSYTEKVLYSFTGLPGSDGGTPFAGLVMDSSGNLYGTTEYGGTSAAAACPGDVGCGTVFELVNSSGSYTEKVLHSFTGLAGGDGGVSSGGLVVDSSGNLYGTTAYGGTSAAAACPGKAGCGIVFELVNSSGSYTEKVLYSFTGTGGDGGEPVAGLSMDSSGGLYGATKYGGTSTACPGGCGTVFKLVNSSGSYTEKVLYSFTGTSGDGFYPSAGVVMDSLGSLYGTTDFGGSVTGVTCAAQVGCGTVFELVNSSGSFTEKVLYSFAGTGGDGGVPYGGLVIDSSGNLYGTSEVGGTSSAALTCSGGCGTVFEIVPGSAGAYAFTATTGSNQSAAVDTAFALPLAVTVRRSGGNPPVSPITVTFTAPAGAGGASGTFANGTAATTATTDPSGVATTSVFTANSAAGSYTVTATAPNVTGTASFSLTNVSDQIQTATTFTTSSSVHSQTLPPGVALVGNPVTVNFTVKPASGTAAPTGTVLVTDGGLGDTCAPSPTPLTTSGTGTCTLTIATFPVGGITSLSAAYTPAAGSAFLASNSFAATEQVVEGVVPCNGAISPVIIKQKASVTETFTACLAGNLNFGAGPLTVRILECLPFARCQVTVTPIPGQPGMYTVSVTMTTSDSGNGTASSPVLPPRGGPGPRPLLLFGFGALLAMLMALQLGRQNRARPRLLYAAGLLFAMALSGMSACNGASNQQITPVGPYTVNVQITAGGTFSATVPLSVTVTK